MKILQLTGVVAVIIVGILVLLNRWYHRAGDDTALIRFGLGGRRVSLSGMFVLPIFHLAESLDISAKRIEIIRTGQFGVLCRDNIRVDIKIAFFVQVKKTPQDILRVVQSLGCKRANNTSALEDFFYARFTETLKTVAYQRNFDEIIKYQDGFKQALFKAIGTDLTGFALNELRIEHMRRTPISLLDPKNKLDADGMKK